MQALPGMVKLNRNGRALKSWNRLFWFHALPISRAQSCACRKSESGSPWQDEYQGLHP